MDRVAVAFRRESKIRNRSSWEYLKWFDWPLLLLLKESVVVLVFCSWIISTMTSTTIWPISLLLTLLFSGKMVQEVRDWWRQSWPLMRSRFSRLRHTSNVRPALPWLSIWFHCQKNNKKVNNNLFKSINISSQGDDNNTRASHHHHLLCFRSSKKGIGAWLKQKKPDNALQCKNTRRAREKPVCNPFCLDKHRTAPPGSFHDAIFFKNLFFDDRKSLLFQPFKSIDLHHHTRERKRLLNAIARLSVRPAIKINIKKGQKIGYRDGPVVLCDVKGTPSQIYNAHCTL